MVDLSYDDSNLQRLFAALEPKQRKELFRSAFKRTGNKVRKVARQNVQSSGLRDANELKKGVRVVTFKREAGFRVTVAGRASTMKNPKREKSMHLTRRGVKVPVLQWAEPGTAMRRTRGAYTRRGFSLFGRSKLRRSGKGPVGRGKMPRYGFMDKTRIQVDGTVQVDLQDEITEAVERIAKKYGIR